MFVKHASVHAKRREALLRVEAPFGKDLEQSGRRMPFAEDEPVTIRGVGSGSANVEDVPVQIDQKVYA
jgi:hypothetical protein